ESFGVSEPSGGEAADGIADVDLPHASGGSCRHGLHLPMHPEIRQPKPAICPKCGMALESDVLAAAKTEYTCPMHPEIIRQAPGSCPLCGMALEPRTVSATEENPELRQMTHRFWWRVALGLR